MDHEVVTDLTGNLNLIPTLVPLGSFLAPVTFAAWAFERQDSGDITAELVFRTFIVGGVLGNIGAGDVFAAPVAVGRIEEAGKLAALALLTRHLAVKSVRDGLILGATVGFGFAALEAAHPAGTVLTDLVTSELPRGLLASVELGLWTAVLGGLCSRGAPATTSS